MTTTIDGAGRLVIPKAIREEAHLEPGVPLEIRVWDGCVEIQPAPCRVEIVRRGRLHVAVTADVSAPLTEEAVRGTRERLRDRQS
ncbi:MAG: AbrB/MazE/SpoVT family DNA-binding domain-containing protein [Candidatus Latescibacterota bacterium]